jgi:3-oxoadipate enol-lactonase
VPEFVESRQTTEMPEEHALAHDDEGSGEPLVLLHSGVCDRRMWAAMRAALPDEWRIIAPDLRGFGASPLPSRDTAYTDAGDVAGLLEAAGIGIADVIGSSMGGGVALELATIRPDLVRSLTLLCPAYDGLERSPAVREFGEAEDRLLEAGDIDAAVELNVDTWLGPDASGSARDLVRTMQRRAFDLQLADPEHPGPGPVEVDPERIEAPTLVVVGGRDVDYFVAVGEHLSRVMPDAQLTRLARSAHLPALEQPVETASIVAAWLTSHRRAE